MGVLLTSVFLISLMWSLLISAQTLVRVINVQEPFDFACSVIKYDCADIPIPTIEVEPIGWAWGMFRHETPNTIYLDEQIVPYFDEVVLQSILAHEMTHYLDFKRGVYDGTPGTVCATEWNGWRVSNAYYITHGRPDLADFNWAERYGCFRT